MCCSQDRHAKLVRLVFAIQTTKFLVVSFQKLCKNKHPQKIKLKKNGSLGYYYVSVLGKQAYNSQFIKWMGLVSKEKLTVVLRLWGSERLK